MLRHALDVLFLADATEILGAAGHREGRTVKTGPHEHFTSQSQLPIVVAVEMRRYAGRAHRRLCAADDLCQVVDFPAKQNELDGLVERRLPACVWPADNLASNKGAVEAFVHFEVLKLQARELGRVTPVAASLTHLEQLQRSARTLQPLRLATSGSPTPARGQRGEGACNSARCWLPLPRWVLLHGAEWRRRALPHRAERRCGAFLDEAERRSVTIPRSQRPPWRRNGNGDFACQEFRGRLWLQVVGASNTRSRVRALQQF
mmetsp:Transcript_68683/g.191377  ORF Transcript_68683/g.191377 Transcript_68683/m.191377 type:complete len:261 (+) Transcript_68683:791-1573(+)